MGKQYIAKIDNLYLQGKDTTSDIEEADIFESETEPRQRINQMKRDGKLNKKAKVTIKALESKNKLFKNVFKESTDEMSLDEYCDSVNSDSHYIEAFKDWALLLQFTTRTTRCYGRGIYGLQRRHRNRNSRQASTTSSSSIET